MTYKWTIFSADLNPVIGSEQGGTRPVLVISDETYNTVMPVVTILPLTSLKAGRKVYPNEALLESGTGHLPRDSIVLAHQIRTISKQRLGEAMGEIDQSSIQDSINEAIRVHLNL
ncbi:MAG TPA: type II toxin-antitoxin system PemK/MazF family toxin [Candidatus Lokiarchaeia archaeon]|nr:type II toxin-antitoxin system PemK/MazF family toxin [Candidatus Lokiarchaeia archaeon]